MRLSAFKIMNAINGDKSVSHSSRAFRPQLLLFCACLLVGISYGMSMGHSAVLLPLLQGGNSSLVIDEEMGSWIASVYAIAAPSGCILSGIVMDFCGRRKLNIIGTSGMIFGWLIITFAQNAIMVIFGRILEGSSRSIMATAITVLIDELASSKYRGCIACGLFTSVTGGILIISLLGAFLHWRTASGLAALVSFLSLLAVFFISESPTWFVKRNRRYDAERALIWLWGPGNEVQVTEELTELTTRLQPEEKSNVKSFKEIINKYFSPQILKPFIILHVYNILQIFCGLGLFTYYTIDFVSKITKPVFKILDDFSAIILISVIRLIVTITASFLMLVVGRRTISIISSVCSSIFAVTLSALLFFSISQNDGLITEEVEAYMTFTLVILYAASMSFGLFMLPSIMIGETQPSHMRGFACGYIYTMNDLILGGIVKLYPWLSANLQIHGLFLIFGISCIVCSVFVHLFLPETQGLTLQQIEDYFQQPNIMWITRNKYNRVRKESQQSNDMNV